MQSHIFSAVVEADQFEDGSPAFHASCPALKGCHTWGHNQQEALARLEEAVELYLDDLRAPGFNCNGAVVAIGSTAIGTAAGS